MKRKYQYLIISLSLIFLLSGCVSSKAPSLEAVKDDFISLIEASKEVNDIFFGEGLPTYQRFYGGGAMNYDAEHEVYYLYFNDPSVGDILKCYITATKEYKYFIIQKTEGEPDDGYAYQNGNEYFYPIDYREPDDSGIYDESSPVYFDYVRSDCKYSNVDDIKAVAEKVYSREYLESIYSAMFDGFADENAGVVFARYLNDESGESGFLLKSNTFKPYFTEQTVYFPETMRVISPSNERRVTVEIEAEGRSLDFNTLETKKTRRKKQLVFVKQGSEWRLDTPTY